MTDKEILKKLADEHGYSDKMGNVSGLFEHFELGYNAAQAEIARLKEEIQQRKEAYHELDDINTRLNDQRVELQSALDVAVEGLEYCKISERNKDRLDVVEPLFLAKLLKIIDSKASERLEKIKQIRGSK